MYTLYFPRWIIHQIIIRFPNPVLYICSSMVHSSRVQMTVRLALLIRFLFQFQRYLAYASVREQADNVAVLKVSEGICVHWSLLCAQGEAAWRTSPITGTLARDHLEIQIINHNHKVNFTKPSPPEKASLYHPAKTEIQSYYDAVESNFEGFM